MDFMSVGAMIEMVMRGVVAQVVMLISSVIREAMVVMIRSLINGKARIVRVINLMLSMVSGILETLKLFLGKFDGADVGGSEQNAQKNSELVEHLVKFKLIIKWYFAKTLPTSKS